MQFISLNSASLLIDVINEEGTYEVGPTSGITLAYLAIWLLTEFATGYPQKLWITKTEMIVF